MAPGSVPNDKLSELQKAFVKEQMFSAVSKGDLKTIDTCLTKGAEINDRQENSDSRPTPFMRAIWRNSKDHIFLEQLLQRGADVDARDAMSGDTPLLYILRRQPRETVTVEFLLNKGANVFAEAKDKKTIFHLIKDVNDLEVQEKLQKILMNALPVVEKDGQTIAADMATHEAIAVGGRMVLHPPSKQGETPKTGTP